jgi:TrmH family RNA methyltransferase
VRGTWQEMTQSLDITSIKDARIVEARELTSAAGRARLQKTQLEGEESIQWALEAHLLIEHIFYSAHVRQRAFLETLQANGIACYAVSDGIMKKISDTTYLVPIIGIARLPPASERSGPAGDFVLVIDRVQDHGNLGTIIRTACAFGICELISTTPDLDLSFKKVVSASRGKAFEAKLYAFSSAHAAIAALKQRGYQIVATSSHAREIQAMAPLLRQADIVVQIPMSGLVESLNVGVATGISLYELKFRMILTMLTHFIRSNFGLRHDYPELIAYTDPPTTSLPGSHNPLSISLS